MTLPPPKICRRIRSLHALMGSNNGNEAAIARESLMKLLAKHSLSWNDIPACINAADDEEAAASGNPRTAAPQGPSSGPEINVLDLTLRLIEKYLAITPDERMAVALWVLHTHVFGRFMVTPRLALLSPVRGCGKTTLRVLLELLCHDPDRSENVTAAAIYHLLATRECTLLIDEGDNLGLLNNNVLRAIFNAGHRRGGAIRRFVGGRSRKFLLFAPLAVAAIGVMPLPLLHRSIIINMQRTATRLEPFDETDSVLIATFAASREQIQRWAATCVLARDPEMPSSLRNRAADNWRVLLAIADDLGHGEDARAAAITLNANRMDEDAGVTLLADIRTVFLARGTDRISSAALVAALRELDDGLWSEWRGPNDNRPPHKLTQGELAQLLRPFEIRPKTVWPAQRRPGDRSSRGYLGSQFEIAWGAYCRAADTATQSSKIIQLPRK